MLKLVYGQITLDFYNNLEVSEKRKHLEVLCQILKRQFNISVLETDSFDDPEKGLLGFSCVLPASKTSVQCEQFLERICKTIDQSAPARVVLEDTDWIEFP